MIKLKNIILQLDQSKFEVFEKSLVKNNSDKFLILLRYYRSENTGNLLELLDCNENALYVLKSRLFDKIQKYLLETNPVTHLEKKSGVITNLNHYFLNYPRDTAIAMIHEIEKEYLPSNDPSRLIPIYSVLKKAYYHSEKHYTYSQLYNKQVAYAISLEKADDILFSFNKNLANYYFSNSAADLELLVILKNEIKNIYALNKSHKAELTLNNIIIQLILFTDLDLSDELPVEDIIQQCETILSLHPDDKQIEHYNLILPFFKFEYYHKIQQLKKSLTYFEIINANSDNWLLYSNYCLAFKFLFSKVEVLSKLNKEQLTDKNEQYNFDNFDFYTTVVLDFYFALKQFYSGQTKKAISLLNKILDSKSFINFPHMEFEMKLTLAYFYFKEKDLELAGNLIKNLSRKITNPDYTKYNNIKDFIKLLNLLVADKKTKLNVSKQITLLEQFNYHNSKERKILQHIQQDIDITLLPKKY